MKADNEVRESHLIGIVFFILILFCTFEVNAQVTLSTETGTPFFRGLAPYIGADIQFSEFSVSLEFRPDYYDKHIYANGIGLITNLFLWKYQSSPFFSMGIITHGRQIDVITNKPVRSMPIVLGYRFYPKDKWNYFSDGFCFDLRVGIELMHDATVKPYFGIQGNFFLAGGKTY